MAASNRGNDPWVRANINAYFEVPYDGIKELDRLITSLPRNENHLQTIQKIVRDYVTMFPHFLEREDKVVEVWGQFWGYRSDHGQRGKLLWETKIIWGEHL
jgi:hypothetical protein